MEGAPVLAERGAHEGVGPDLQQDHVLGDLGAREPELDAACVAMRLRQPDPLGSLPTAFFLEHATSAQSSFSCQDFNALPMACCRR